LHGHGISIGSETAGGVRNVTVKNCTFENTENGLRIKSDSRRGGLVENISYENISMTNVMPAITLTCVYQQNSAGDARQQPVPAAKGDRIPIYRDIVIKNLTATCPGAAGLIQGLLGNCISNVLLENVTISAAKSFEVRDARGIRLKNVSVAVAGGKPFALENADVSGWGTDSR
jgi:polygalacturonase